MVSVWQTTVSRSLASRFLDGGAHSIDPDCALHYEGQEFQPLNRSLQRRQKVRRGGDQTGRGCYALAVVAAVERANLVIPWPIYIANEARVLSIFIVRVYALSSPRSRNVAAALWGSGKLRHQNLPSS